LASCRSGVLNPSVNRHIGLRAYAMMERINHISA
jgi:hypothetical protein